MTVKQHLALPPVKTKQLSIQDGSDEKFDYIPIAEIENELDHIFHSWNLHEWRYDVKRVGKENVVDASVVLSVNYDESTARRLIGSTSFGYRTGVDNADLAMSLCIKRAARKLGIRFGRALNDRIEPEKETLKPSTKIEPDMINVQKWKNAIFKQDQDVVDELESLYDFTKYKPK